MDPEKTFEVWLESTSQHTLTGWKNRCQTKGTPCLLSTLLMFVPYSWLEPKRLKTSKHLSLFLENCCVVFSRFLSSCKDLKYLENGKKTKKCESWDLTKWTPNCKMCKEMSSGECCEQECQWFGHSAVVSFRAPTFSFIFFFWDLAN